MVTINVLAKVGQIEKSAIWYQAPLPHKANLFLFLPLCKHHSVLIKVKRFPIPIIPSSTITPVVGAKLDGH